MRHLVPSPLSDVTASQRGTRSKWNAAGLAADKSSTMPTTRAVARPSSRRSLLDGVASRARLPHCIAGPGFTECQADSETGARAYQRGALRWERYHFNEAKSRHRGGGKSTDRTVMIPLELDVGSRLVPAHLRLGRLVVSRPSLVRDSHLKTSNQSASRARGSRGPIRQMVTFTPEFRTSRPIES